MKPVVKTITCPKCGEKQNFTMYPSINASSDPGLAEKYLDGNLTTLTCEGCGFSGVVEYPMLYHDLGKKFSIFFAPDKTDREAKLPNVLPAHLLPEMRLRLVHNADDLREKIFIFRDLLDDRIVETVKDSILREMDARQCLAAKDVPSSLFQKKERNILNRSRFRSRPMKRSRC